MEYGWSTEVRTYDLCKTSPMDLFSYFFFSYLILFLAFPRVSTRLEFSEYACA